MKWRLLDSGLVAPGLGTAIDEAILNTKQTCSVPDTMHLYVRNAPTVSLGYFQPLNDSVNMSSVVDMHAHIVRRITGGGSIYTDNGHMIYSAIFDRCHFMCPSSELSPLISEGVVKALNILGIEGEYEPPNDVTVNGRKISGSARIRRRDLIMQQGTLIIDADIISMFRSLRSSKRLPEGITSIKEELGYSPPMEIVKKAMVNGFASALGCDMCLGQLTSEERQLSETLMNEKYARPVI